MYALNKTNPDGIHPGTTTGAIALTTLQPAIHSHPIHGGMYEANPVSPSNPSGPANEKEGPSPGFDYPNSFGRQRDNPSRYRDVVIGPNNIYLYKGYNTVGKMSRSFFTNK